jgi:hypothetical protein
MRQKVQAVRQAKFPELHLGKTKKLKVQVICPKLNPSFPGLELEKV